ncbi:Cysteine synthase 2 [Zancudomyces culisetae]|uniref:Cysteine synthase 2 n=1 Tax=Zancudomyces culisetae TaxID=1213189 RepID=A0A1R1PE22_ZANCU|nr:Cysteine synthase 2 [Zancudomyces culisetae]OMH79245.1 Cysteine synthase 2 [Zancudomyces culisetae]OMH82734.1 Cysteine synthase 2 [Zancudomyces culisetae]|eukprot:OMH78585.1 Cysteine synthase 2 [Zancudomyces culisetae]
MAEKEGKLVPNTDSCVFEGTSGSTGISVCMVAKAKGYKVFIVMPNDVASEKKTILESMGATVEMVRPCSIVESENYVRVAERRALEYNSEDGNGTSKKGYFLDQFENPHNFMAHYKHTGPEILVQTGGKIDAFVHGSGTGGTIAGVTLFLKPRIPHLKVFLADPYGSGNANKVNYGVMFSQTEKEGTRRRYQTDTLVEGVGLNRLTSNFARLFRKGSRSHGCGVNGAYTIDDQATIWMSRYIMENDGLFLGSSSALNLVATVKVAKLLGPGATILTILCDSGQRHLTKFWNNDLLQSKGFDVSIPTSLDVFL